MNFLSLLPLFAMLGGQRQPGVFGAAPHGAGSAPPGHVMAQPQAQPPRGLLGNPKAAALLSLGQGLLASARPQQPMPSMLDRPAPPPAFGAPGDPLPGVGQRQPDVGPDHLAYLRLLLARLRGF